MKGKSPRSVDKRLDFVNERSVCCGLLFVTNKNPRFSISCDNIQTPMNWSLDCKLYSAETMSNDPPNEQCDDAKGCVKVKYH
jgi:hypothetical protein